MPVTKRRDTSSRKKYLLFSVLIVVAALVVGGGVILHVRQDNRKSNAALSKSSHVNTVNYGPSTPSDNTANNNRKASTSPSNTLNDQSSSSPSTNSSSITATIVSSTVSNDNLHVGTMVSGATSGTCSLSATQGSQQISLATANVQQDVNEYDCGVFNIATSKFPSTGAWVLTLTVTSGGQQSTASANVTITSND
jgi:cytoskeletal protein RodZ